MRKETLHKYKSLGWKSDLEIWIPVTSIDQEVSRRCRALNLRFKPRQIQLSRSYRGAVEEAGAFSINPPAIERCQAICLQLSRGVKLSIRKCRAIYSALMNSFSSLISWSNLHGFNTKLKQHVSWSIKHILDLPKYK